MDQFILSLNYGKDSIACLAAIEQLGWPLDRIVHAEVWATDTIPADLPPMVEFKAKADAIIKERWGITVEHLCATTNYAECFHKPITKQKEGFEDRIGLNRGFPYQKGPWCQRDLKVSVLDSIKKLTYDDLFHKTYTNSKTGRNGKMYGFPKTVHRGGWCHQLKNDAFRKAKFPFLKAPHKGLI
jgi:3'-phosphoadenosine 5'-phosphosulfate sulfotransferase (PAPS reductase)/FAD synthetase